MREANREGGREVRGERRQVARMEECRRERGKGREEG